MTYPVSASLRKGLAARARLAKVAKMIDFIVNDRARETSRYKGSAVRKGKSHASYMLARKRHILAQPDGREALESSCASSVKLCDNQTQST